MSLFKRLTSSKQDSPSPFRQMLGGKAAQSKSTSSSTSSSRATPYGSTSSVPSDPHCPGSPQQAVPADPATCLEVFKFHWKQALAIIQTGKSGERRGSEGEVEAVMRYVDQMVLILVEEPEGRDGSQGPSLEYLLTENILEVILTWSLQYASNNNNTGGTNSNGQALRELATKLRLHQLKMYELLISQCKQSLLVHKPIIRPLLKLLSACEDHTHPNVQEHLILILHQLCVSVTQNKYILELLFNATADHGSASFLVFSLLIPYVHHEGSVGQQARDALLLIMSLSYSQEDIALYVAHNSHFCPVLATGLSGLYSSLPQKIKYPRDDWCQLTSEDVTTMPDLIMFLNSLEFCNAVVQVAHPVVRDQLVHFIYNGFLVPVLGPALHQNEVMLGDESDVDSLMDSDHEDDDDLVNSVEEVIAATAYTDLFLRRITEPTLICTFLRFILSEKFDDNYILDSLIQRVHSNSRLCMVSLVLFHTLISLNCEDVMFQLVFKYIMPCTHVMVSQRRAVRDVDIYNKTAEKLLSLVPACCQRELLSQSSVESESSTNLPAAPSLPLGTSTPQASPVKPTPKKRFQFSFRRKNSQSSTTTASPVTKTESVSSVSETTSLASEGNLSEVTTSSFGTAPVTSLRDLEAWTLGNSTASPGSVRSMGGVATSLDGISLSDASLTSQPPPPPPHTFRTGYKEYLAAARHQIDQCSQACRVWSSSYSGQSPAPNTLTLSRPQPATPSGQEQDKVTLTLTPPPGGFNHDKAVTQVVNDLPSSITNGKPSVPFPPITMTGQDLCSKQPSVTCEHETVPIVALPSSDGGGHTLDKSLSDSECDSAVSSGSIGAHSPEELVLPFREDSPLVDNFHTDDFNSFLLQLKRVKTPVEFCDNLEETFSDIEAMVREFESQEVPLGTRLTLEEERPKRPRSMLASPAMECLPCFIDIPPKLTRPTSLSPMSSLVPASRNPSALSLPGSILSPTADTLRRGEIASRGSGIDVETPSGSSGKGAATSPDIGPFLTALLCKLECMMQNSLYVNLHLTGLVTRLASHPHPLLRSFLLNTSLVFQPSVKSLIQVLSSVKHKLDNYSYTVKEFDIMLAKARKYLSWREDVFLRGDDVRHRSDSNFSILAASPKSLVKQDAKRRGSAIGDFFFGRNKNKQEPPKPTNRLQLLGDGRGYHYSNQSAAKGGTPGDGISHIEALRTKNAVYCALVLEEFLKELSALAQVHAVMAQEL